MSSLPGNIAGGDDRPDTQGRSRDWLSLRISQATMGAYGIWGHGDSFWRVASHMEEEFLYDTPTPTPQKKMTWLT